MICSEFCPPRAPNSLPPTLTYCRAYLSVMKFTTRAAVAAVFCTASSGTAVVVSSWTPRLSSNVFLSSSATATSTTYQSFTPLIARRSGLRPRTAAAAGGGGRGATASGGVEKKYPVVLEAALDLQERLRKLCADKSTDKGDQRARIETLAEVGVPLCRVDT